MSFIARRGILFLAALMLVCAAGVGCNTFPPNLDVRLDSETRQRQNVEVHVFAVNKANYQRLQSVRMTDYWAPGGEGRAQIRNQGCKIFQLSSYTASVNIPKDDPIWQRWGDSSNTHLMVLADLSNAPNRDTSIDPRRGAMPLDRDLKYAKDVTVTISRSGVIIEPMPSRR